MAGGEISDLAWLAIAAFLAGLVDSVIGGGGMIQLPALFVVYPGAVPAVLLGTNKLAALAGTAGAAVQYARQGGVSWRVVGPASIGALVASVLGAIAVSRIPAEPLRLALPFILVALLVYTLTTRMGLEHRPRHKGRAETVVATGGTSAIGFYDGFFGPGAGAFYKLLYVRGLGYDFMRAAAPSKLANVGSNVGALLVFLLAGQIMWQVALVMALANFAGGQIGSRIAIRYGSGFVRVAFIAIVAALIVKTFHDAYMR